MSEQERREALADDAAWSSGYAAGRAAERATTAALDVERLAEAWANVMDGRRIGEGLHAARIGRDTTTPADWRAIATEYAVLDADGSAGETER